MNFQANLSQPHNCMDAGADQLRFLDANNARPVFELFTSLTALQKLRKEHSSKKARPFIIGSCS